MAAHFFCKKDTYHKNYHIEGQLIKESVRTCYVCSCFLKQCCNINTNYGWCDYKTCKKCCKCGTPVLNMNWDKITQFMNTGELYRDEIAVLINENKLAPLTQNFSKYILLNQKIKKFNGYTDYNAFVIAKDENHKFKLFMFTKYAKNIISNGIYKTIDEIELCKININPKTTILTPNWNGDGINMWLN